MAGATITLTVHDEAARRLFRELGERCRNPKPALAAIGDLMVESVQRNFEEKRSPDGAPWAPVSAAYAAWKTRHKGRNADDILVLNRILMGSINRRATAREVAVGSNMPYAAVHQFGGRTGRKGTATMPARPFLGVRESDWADIREIVTLFMTRGLA